MFASLAKAGAGLSSAWAMTKGLFGGIFKLGVGATAVGGAAVVGDVAFNGARGTSSVIEGVGGVAGRALQEVAQTDAAVKRDAEVAQSSSGFQAFFAWLGNFFSIIGLNGAARAMDNMVDKIEKRAYDRDQERKAQRDAMEHGQDGPALDGDWSLGSVTHNLADGAVNSVVDMFNAPAAAVEAVWDMAHGQNFGQAFAQNFQENNESIMGAFHRHVMAAPEAPDTAAEHAASFTGGLLGYLLPVGVVAKTGGGIASALVNRTRTITPQVAAAGPAAVLR